MKKLVLLVLIGLFSLNINAQKAKVRSVGFKFYHLPSDPLVASVKNYGVIVNNTSTKVNIGNDRINKYLRLQGFEKTELSKAGVLLEFSVYGVQTNVDIKSKEVKEKVDEKEVKKIKYYYYISSKTTSKFELKYNSGQTIKTMNFNGGGYLFTQESGLYNSKAEAQKALNNKKTALLKNADDSGLQNVLESVKNYLDDHYAYYYTTVYEVIATGKGKKLDYSDLDEAVELYKEAVAEYGLKGVSEVFVKKSDQCIEIWKSAIDEFQPDNKKARISKKNIDELYMNVAIAYLYMNEFIKARKTIDQALLVGKSENIEKNFIKKINIRKDRYDKNEKRKLGTQSVNKLNKANKTIVTTGGYAMAIAIKGINSEFRIKNITKKYKSGINEITEKTRFFYDGNRLKYKMKDSKNRVDSIAYSYSARYINEKPNYYVKSKPKNWVKDDKSGITYDIINNSVVKRTKRGEELIYKYNESGGLNALVRHTKNYYDDLMYRYSFEYNASGISRIRTYRFFEGDWKEQADEALVIKNSGTVVDKIKGAKMYRLQKSGERITKITKYKNFNETKLDMEYVFSYDTHGNIVKQSFKNSYGNVETYEIEYEQKEGNEELFMATNDWAINTYFHQLCFNDYFEVSY